MKTGKERLTRDAVRDATCQEIDEMRLLTSPDYPKVYGLKSVPFCWLPTNEDKSEAYLAEEKTLLTDFFETGELGIITHNH